MKHLALLFIPSLALAGLFSSAPSETVLAEKGKALLPVAVASNASPAVLETAAALASNLTRMTGAPFTLVTNDGAAGLVVGRPQDFPALPFKAAFETGPFHREDYLLRSGRRGLWLLGAADEGVSHAAWDLLHRLGHRQFFPGPVWEVVPQLEKAALAVEVRETPAFYSRRIWYNWGLWGYNNQPYREWCVRNRHLQGFRLNSGHAYESIIAANRAEFDAHPEYLSLVNGQRKKGGDAKFCVSNPGLRQLVVEHAVRQVKARPDTDSLSMDPSDGDNWCECEPCAAMGSPSDRALTLANAVAAAINGLGLGDKYVGMYAYNRHGAPPSIAVHPKVIVSATTAFIRGGLTLDGILEGWKARGATLGIYDYFSVVDWDWNMPLAARAANPQGVANAVRDFHRKGARFYDCESGDAWGPCGLGFYVAARTMWDTNEASRVEAMTADFLDKAFGPAKEPMAAFYTLLTDGSVRRPRGDLIGRLYRALAEARKSAGARPDVLARLDDLTLYVRYVELYHKQSQSGRKEDRDTMVTFVYRMRKTMMIHAYGLWARTVGQKAAGDPAFPLKSEEPVTREELDSILARGIADNPPVEMGFTPASFSGDYIPATALRLPAVPAGTFPSNPQDRHLYCTWMETAPASLSLTVTVQRVWNLRPHKVRLYSPLETSLEPVAESGIVVPDGKPYTVELKTPHEGLHTVEVIDGGDYTRIQWPANRPVMVQSGPDSPAVSSFFRGGWTLYAYVPKGTKTVGGWAARVAAWAPRISGLLKDADGHTVLDFGQLDEGWFSAAVPPGQDGRLWKFENSQGMRQLMTIPPCLARSAEELMLPKEVVEKDAPAAP